ncbi:MAG TPA: helix-turn-helix transcriptional regulator [Verrucomicrobiae bacterium]|nr:helix-turn-helix transcriptional regulator [Verrucomicrobiae bacterium]
MKETFRKSLGETVQQRRQELRLTQDELAKLSALHRTYISDVERGTRNVSLDTLVQLSKGLSISLSTLFSNAERRASAHVGGDDRKN